MSIPDLTFYKLPLTSVTVATATGLMDALFLALSSATDYRGTALPASHVWAFTKIGATNGVYATPPAGTTMTMAPGLVWALGGATGNSTYLTPDSFTVNAPNIGVVTERGAFVAWDNANPWASGRWSGYWRFGSAPYANVACRIQCYISQEVVISTMYTQAGGAMVACALGAILSPHSTTPDTADKDGRLYGMWTTGGTAIASNFFNLASGFFTHSTASTLAHMGVFRPGSSSAPAAGVSNASVYPGGRTTLWPNGATSLQQDMAGRWIKRPITVCESIVSSTPTGEALGVLRGTYMIGVGSGGYTVKNIDGEDDIHLIGGSVQGNPAQVAGLQAAV